MKISDKVICIKEPNAVYKYKQALTYNKEYVVTEVLDICVYIIDDNGRESIVDKECFTTIPEMRRKKLERILKNVDRD